VPMFGSTCCSVRAACADIVSRKNEKIRALGYVIGPGFEGLDLFNPEGVRYFIAIGKSSFLVSSQAPQYSEFHWRSWS
jgi:hypothetical protein